MHRGLMALGFLFIFAGVSLLPLYPYSLGSVHYGAYAGFADIQYFELRSGVYVSLGLHEKYASALFSLQAPDGSYLLRNQNTTSLFHYSFWTNREGFYILNFSVPGVPYTFGFDANVDITFHQAFFGKSLLSAGSCIVRLPSSPPTLPSKVGCAGETGRVIPECGACP